MGAQSAFGIANDGPCQINDPRQPIPPAGALRISDTSCVEHAARVSPTAVASRHRRPKSAARTCGGNYPCGRSVAPAFRCRTPRVVLRPVPSRPGSSPNAALRLPTQRCGLGSSLTIVISTTPRSRTRANRGQTAWGETPNLLATTCSRSPSTWSGNHAAPAVWWVTNLASWAPRHRIAIEFWRALGNQSG